MEIEYEKMTIEHCEAFLDIYNYYSINDFSVFSDIEIPTQGFKNLLQSIQNYPAFAIKFDKIIVGFCYLNPFAPSSVFNESAEASIYIHKDFIMKRIGRYALIKMEKEAISIGIKNLFVRIVSKNPYMSIRNKFGYIECARFKNVGKKFNDYFDIIWLQKEL